MSPNSMENIAEEEECEESLAEAGDDGGKSLSRRRASDALRRLSLHSEMGSMEGSSSMRYINQRHSFSSVRYTTSIGERISIEEGSSSMRYAKKDNEGGSSSMRFNQRVSFDLGNGNEGSSSLTPSPLPTNRNMMPTFSLDQQQDTEIQTSSAKIYPAGQQLTEPDQPLLTVDHEVFWSYMETISVLFHLATFGILGVLIRYGLQVFFGPNVAEFTSENSALYPSLPPNMVGSFFMGWVGVIFKKKISTFSESLAIGLSTGLMGSITTFSAWMHSVTKLTSHGHWVAGILGILLGMELAQISLVIGIEVAQGLNFLFTHLAKSNHVSILVVSHIRKFYSIIVIVLYGALWGGSILLSIMDLKFKHKHKIGLACIIGPMGVWIRWYLSQLNGKGVMIKGKKYFKWCPFGTLLANLLATTIMAILSVIDLKANDETRRLVIGAITLGLLGCMSTVSTFVVEVRALYQSKNPHRAYAYIFMTIFFSFLLQTLMYSIPVWIGFVP